MAKGPDQSDNVTKLDNPVLRLKTPTERSASSPNKTGSTQKKPHKYKAGQAKAFPKAVSLKLTNHEYNQTRSECSD